MVVRRGSWYLPDCGRYHAGAVCCNLEEGSDDLLRMYRDRIVLWESYD